VISWTALGETNLIALLVLALAATSAPAPRNQLASVEECRVIDAAVGSGLAATLALAPEQVIPPGTDERSIFERGRPPFRRGLAAADISYCVRANRPHDPIPGSDTSLIVSRAAIDEAAGRAAVLFDHPCGAGGVIHLARDKNGEWIRTGARLWSHACDRPPLAPPRGP
jgi:hypothetical protein